MSSLLLLSCKPSVRSSFQLSCSFAVNSFLATIFAFFDCADLGGGVSVVRSNPSIRSCLRCFDAMAHSPVARCAVLCCPSISSPRGSTAHFSTALLRQRSLRRNSWCPNSCHSSEYRQLVGFFIFLAVVVVASPFLLLAVLVINRWYKRLDDAKHQWRWGGL